MDGEGKEPVELFLTLFLERMSQVASTGVERGFRFLKDPLFLASSVFVKKPERIIALPFDHGPLLAGLSFSRIPAAGTPGRDRANHS